MPRRRKQNEASPSKGKVYEFEFPLQNDQELKAFIWYAFGIRVPDVAVCPGHVSPFQIISDAYFARSPVIVVKASRGFAGKSFNLGLLGLVEALTLKCDVNILGGSGDQSEKVLGYVNAFASSPGATSLAAWDAQNEEEIPLLPHEGLKAETPLGWGNRIQALEASQNSVRGPHVPRLRLDEIDEMDLTILDAALGQTMSTSTVVGQTLLSSTHHHAQGTFTEILKRAAERGWTYHSYCYKETLEPHGWLPRSEIERKKIEVTNAMWQVEYEGQEPSPESRAIQPQFVDNYFDRTLGVYNGAPFEYIEVEPPQPHGVYVHGADWARKKDWTVIVTFRTDVFPMRLVAFERLNKVEWPVMVSKFDTRISRYGGMAYHDVTGVGDVVAGYLTTNAFPILFSARLKAEIMTKYIRAIELGELKAPYISFMDAEHRYASFDDVYLGQGYNSHTPDSIVAGALAYLGAWPARSADQWIKQMQGEQAQRLQTQEGIALPPLIGANDWAEAVRRIQNGQGQTYQSPTSLSPWGGGIIPNWNSFFRGIRRG